MQNFRRRNKYNKIVKNYGEDYKYYNKIYDKIYDKISLKDQEYCRNVIHTRHLIQKNYQPLMDQFLEVHAPIKKYFCNGSYGLKLANKDSKMATEICYHFAKQNIPILPMHDSFLVQEQYADELKKKMDEVYAKHNKGFKCPVTVKNF